MNNLLLEQLSEGELKLLEPHLKPTHFKQHQLLFEPDEQIGSVYFPTGAVVSLVVTLSTGEMVEAAMVGRDGVLGGLAALDGKMTLSRGEVRCLKKPSATFAADPSRADGLRASTAIGCVLCNPPRASQVVPLAVAGQGFVRERHALVHAGIFGGDARGKTHKRDRGRPHAPKRGLHKIRPRQNPGVE